MISRSVQDRLAARSRPAENGCIVWIGPAHDAMGYGRIRIGRRMVYIHRAAWEAARGPVPDGAVVRHTCDNPPCINVDHLTLGTQAENVADMFTRGRVDRHGERNNSARLTTTQVAQIRARRTGGETQRALAREFGVSESQISNIIRNRHWRNSA